MASKELDNRALSLFCENMAMLLGAGIGPEEAAGLLCEDSADSLFHDAAQAVQKHLLVQGGTLSGAAISPPMPAGCWQPGSGPAATPRP